MNKKIVAIISVIVIIAVGAGVYFTQNQSKNNKRDQMSGMSMSSSKMKESSSDDSMSMSMMMDGKLPTGLAEATNPKYKVGQEITLLATHMPNMKGAKGTVAAAYDTKLYAVDFTPTNSDKAVKNHKWLTMVDFSDHMEHKVGDEVTLDSDHMVGMKGAKAKVVKVVDGPAYAVNFTPTNGGKMVMNHLYLDQDEIEAR